ncbi:2-dehydro-3-deoxyphosphogluconate aldolase, partial [Micromonospora chokoriensis]
TEAQQALRHGLTWLKAFPAITLGPAWFKALAGPLPQLRFVATGGLDAGNAAPFLQAGVRVVAVGSALSDPSQLDRLAELALKPPTP